MAINNLRVSRVSARIIYYVDFTFRLECFPNRLVLEAQNPNNPIQATEERSVGVADAAPWQRVGDTQLRCV